MMRVFFYLGTEMAQLVCGGCHTLLMYIRGATSVQCSCCHTINLALEGNVNPKYCHDNLIKLVKFQKCEHLFTANQVAHVNCGNCRMLLMYQYGARSVKCAVCQFITSVGVSIKPYLSIMLQLLTVVPMFLLMQFFNVC